MDSLKVALGARSYPIHIGPGLIADSALYSTAAKQILIVSNERVAPLYLDAVRAALGRSDVQTVVLPDGERHKTLATFASILDRLVDANVASVLCRSPSGSTTVCTSLRPSAARTALRYSGATRSLLTMRICFAAVE